MPGGRGTCGHLLGSGLDRLPTLGTGVVGPLFRTDVPAVEDMLRLDSPPLLSNQANTPILSTTVLTFSPQLPLLVPSRLLPLPLGSLAVAVAPSIACVASLPPPLLQLGHPEVVETMPIGQTSLTGNPGHS